MILLKSCDLSCLAVALPDEVEKYKAQGDFSSASEAIERWLLKPVGGAMKQHLQVEREILRQLPGQFPYTEEQTIALFRENVPDFDRTDLKRLDEAGLAEWIFVNGKKHYIRSIVRNVTLKDPEIRRRSGKETGESREKKILKEELAWLRTHGESRWRFRLRASVKLAPALFRPGMHLRAHLPVPAERYQISEVKILSHSDCDTVIDSPEAPYRAVCMEETLSENREFFVEYEYMVKAEYHDLWAALDGEEKSGQEKKFYIDDTETEARQKEKLCSKETEAGSGRKEKLCSRETEAGSGRKEKLCSKETEAGSGQKEKLCSRETETEAGRKAGKNVSSLPDFREFLQEQPPHICFSPYLRALAAEVTAGARTPLAAAARIYDYITKNVKYSFMRSYFLIPEIPEYCARNLRGDCGVQALLFITLCRISGIPAGWQSGLHTFPEQMPLPLRKKENTMKNPVPDSTGVSDSNLFLKDKTQHAAELSSGADTASFFPESEDIDAEPFFTCEAGSHDWAMFWIEEYGWLYADPSFGGSAFADGDEERRRFYFGNLDPFRMAANHAFMQPFAAPKRFLADDPCDNQSGELESDEAGYESDELEQKKTLLKAEILPPRAVPHHFPAIR